jgi:hypothetical protein
VARCDWPPSTDHRQRDPEHPALRHRLSAGDARLPAHRHRRANDTGSRPAPFRIPIHFQRKHGLILRDQSLTLDKQRLVRRLGTIGGRTQTPTLAALREMFEE